jgi:hypothetical protein
MHRKTPTSYVVSAQGAGSRFAQLYEQEYAPLISKQYVSSVLTSGNTSSVISPKFSSRPASQALEDRKMGYFLKVKVSMS